jgi:glucose-1-phosphate thymidylyltransferase
LLEAAQFVQIIEHRQGLKICCPEEIAYKNGFIDDDQLLRQADALGKSGYGDYLRSVLGDRQY